LLIAAQDHLVLAASTSRRRQLIAGFEVSINCRFWVPTEEDVMIPLIELACRGRTDCVIRAYGEMVDVLWQAGQTAAAIRLEMLWNQLAENHFVRTVVRVLVGTLL
jgi:hypothetical protein